MIKSTENSVLVTVAARGGSKGVKNKNIRLLCGVPLIAHTIQQAKRWAGAERIICSTDSDQIADVARKHGADVPFMRPPELATDTMGKLEVLRHAVKTVENESGKVYPIIVDLDATAPARKISDIEGALQLFLEKRPKTVFSVVRARRNPYFNMVETDGEGRAVLAKALSSNVKRRQDAPKVYDMNASIYVYDRDYLIDESTQSAISDRSFAYVMDEISGFDIDSELDFQFIEFLVSKGVITL
jgi:CMP-N,N'-diacetyllegionaminic acid synthase